MADRATISTVEDLFVLVERLDLSSVRYEVKKLRAIREWALGRLGVDYTVGDRVTIKDGYVVKEKFSDGHHNGWWPYRECLVPGATATVKAIDFNACHSYWYADIVLDHEWSVSGDGQTRYWHGAADKTPSRMTPPVALQPGAVPRGSASHVQLSGRVPGTNRWLRAPG